MSDTITIRVLILVLFILQFFMISWKTIVIIRMQRDLTELNRFVRTWGERMLTKTAREGKAP